VYAHPCLFGLASGATPLISQIFLATGVPPIFWAPQRRLAHELDKKRSAPGLRAGRSGEGELQVARKPRYRSVRDATSIPTGG
jgi:hypothetical protein